MKKTAIGCGVLAVLGLILLVIVLIARGGYNRLVQLSQQTDSSWAQAQTDYERRMDLIPNLVATVSGAANFEKSTLTQITEARASVGRVNFNAKAAPGDPAQLAAFDQAQTQLSSALSRLLVVVERYPDLKSSANFLTLQAQLEGTENRIAVARRDFNDAVQKYNTAIKSFPAVLYAGALGFHEKPYFNAAPGAETAPKVQFDFNQAAPAPAPAKPPPP
jgi:LemA protein